MREREKGSFRVRAEQMDFGYKSLMCEWCHVYATTIYWDHNSYLPSRSKCRPFFRMLFDCIASVFTGQWDDVPQLWTIPNCSYYAMKLAEISTGDNILQATFYNTTKFTSIWWMNEWKSETCISFDDIHSRFIDGLDTHTHFITTQENKNGIYRNSIFISVNRNSFSLCNAFSINE